MLMDGKFNESQAGITGDQFALIQEQFKQNMETLIEQGQLELARELLAEYENIVPNDIDVYSIKGIIAMLEGNYTEAERVFRAGLSLAEDNFDLLYNMGYLYQVKNEAELAAAYYKKALLQAKNENDEKSVSEILSSMGVNDKKEDLLRNQLSDAYYLSALQFEKEGNNSDAALNYGLAYRFAVSNSYKQKLTSLYNSSDSQAWRNIFSAAAQSGKKKFIILSSCGWGDVYQRMHHIARALVKLGHEVRYLTPTASGNVSSDVSIDVLTEYSLRHCKTVDGVKIYTPIQAVYNEQKTVNNYTSLIQHLLAEGDLRNVIVAYMPYQVKAVNSLQGDFTLIYECVDDHSDLEHSFWSSNKDVIWEQELMDKADFITTTSVSLFLQRLAVEGRGNVWLSRNAVNEADFLFADDEMPEDLKNIPAPRIVYSGAVYDWFDTDTFFQVVENNKDKSFVIIGFGKEDLLKEMTAKLPNLYHLGAKKHSDLKKYLRHMDSSIIPFKTDIDLIINCDPIKQYEYIACKLPVVTTFIPDAAIGKINTFLARTAEEFNVALKKSLDLQIDKNTKDGFLLENSWNARAALLVHLADRECDGTEQKKTVEQLEKDLDRVLGSHNVPVLQTLKAMCSSSIQQAEEFARAAYKNGYNVKYVERYYLYTLWVNKKINEFVKTAVNSAFIRDELKEELLFCVERKDLQLLECVAHLCFGQVRKALLLSEKIGDKDKRRIYQSYILHILGEKVHSNKLNIAGKKRDLPLYKYMKGLLDHKVISFNRGKNTVCLVDLFDSISQDFIRNLGLNSAEAIICGAESGEKHGFKKITLKKVFDMLQTNDINKLVVPYDIYYIKQIRTLAAEGINECEVAVKLDNNIVAVKIDKQLMQRIKNHEYKKTVTLNIFNAADSNVHALIKHIPEEYKHRYHLNIIYGRDVWSLENIVKVPLISNVTVSGFATFLYNYPKFTYNIEINHSGVPLKACGLLDKKDKNSGGNAEIFQKADCVCVTSHLQMVLHAAFYAIPEHKFRITGLPRNDMLLSADAKAVLQRLLGIDLGSNKIIFNMPTFHLFEQTGRVEGSKELSDWIKIENFDYEKFNLFLQENNLICISKVHHGEEKTLAGKRKNREYSNMFFITNADLEEKNVDLYEVLGAGDLLLTDYSSIYGDFLFMNKPVIFVTTDIEEYRQERGLALEPYDFWTAGPHVNSQEQLQREILNYISDPDYYRQDRERLRKVFNNYHDTNNVRRVWQVIEEGINKMQ